MIAWPNTVLLTGPEPIVVDPGYQTQGDMLAGALARRGLGPDDVRTVVMTHLHSDHLSAVGQLGDVELVVHEDELDTPWARTQRGLLDAVRVTALTGEEGEIRDGLRWVHTPGHSPGHIAVLVETDEGLVAVAGDTLGPDPEWFARMDPPADLPEREAHLAAYRRLRELSPAVIVPGHNPPFPWTRPRPPAGRFPPVGVETAPEPPLGRSRMDLRSITRENKQLVAAGAGVLFIVSLFFPWYGAGDATVNGWDLVVSSWIPLIFTLLAIAVLAADAFRVDLPVRVNASAFAAYCTSIPLIVTAMYLFDGNGLSRKWGIFLALVFSAVACIASAIVWREDV